MDTEDETGSARPALLPVRDIYLEGIVLPARHAPALLRLAAPLIAVAVAIGVLASTAGEPDAEAISASKIILMVVLVFVAAVLMTRTIVGIHRVYLLGGQAVSGENFGWWSAREWRFVGWSFAVSIFSFLVAIPFMLLTVPFFSLFDGSAGIEESFALIATIQFIINIPIAYFIGRWSLVFPATAVDERPNLRWAWDISRGNSWRLMLLVGLTPFIVQYLLTLLPQFESIAYLIVVATLWVYILAAEIGLLSLCYRALTREAGAS